VGRIGSVAELGVTARAGVEGAAEGTTAGVQVLETAGIDGAE